MRRYWGRQEARRCLPFDYTKQTLLGVKAFEKAKAGELARVRPMRGVWGAVGDGYEKRWPDTWEQELLKKLNGPGRLRCVTDLIDHMIAESTRVMAGTAHAHDFIIAHDALSQLWETGAWAYVESKGFGHRFLRCLGETNVGTRYHNKLVGDRPENSPLDTHLNSDVEVSCRMHRALTANLHVDDPRKFKWGTPEEVLCTVLRVWGVVTAADGARSMGTTCIAPTDARILKDIRRWPHSVDQIIAAEGTVVYMDGVRRGRRKVRKAWAYHPDCKPAIAGLKKEFDAFGAAA